VSILNARAQLPLCSDSEEAMSAKEFEAVELG
jgi:hypothetical protein